MFGRSHDLRQLDQALRSVDVHPAVVPEAVKLTTVNLLKDDAGSDDPAPEAYRAAAEIVGYCMVGADIFAGANEAEVVLAVERRIPALSSLAAAGRCLSWTKGSPPGCGCRRRASAGWPRHAP